MKLKLDTSPDFVALLSSALETASSFKSKEDHTVASIEHAFVQQAVSPNLCSADSLPVLEDYFVSDFWKVLQRHTYINVTRVVS